MRSQKTTSLEGFKKGNIFIYQRTSCTSFNDSSAQKDTPSPSRHTNVDEKSDHHHNTSDRLDAIKQDQAPETTIRADDLFIIFWFCLLVPRRVAVNEWFFQDVLKDFKNKNPNIQQDKVLDLIKEELLDLERLRKSSRQTTKVSEWLAGWDQLIKPINQENTTPSTSVNVPNTTVHDDLNITAGNKNALTKIGKVLKIYMFLFKDNSFHLLIIVIVLIESIIIINNSGKKYTNFNKTSSTTYNSKEGWCSPPFTARTICMMMGEKLTANKKIPAKGLERLICKIKHTVLELDDDHDGDNEGRKKKEVEDVDDNDNSNEDNICLAANILSNVIENFATWSYSITSENELIACLHFSKEFFSVSPLPYVGIKRIYAINRLSS
ncbi:hypothetical protein BDA99DRAFT_531363 [Phascolomyces articulosus]|uniref:Uncharacterized protein n=1 Tax=Phascolomyces articulosus TaxID=60185 RepID=A0AAD5KC63_9FUNG|nr:hypothetical protein BDA99DRAFT_531363 [Phascolomyces articulosus]